MCPGCGVNPPNVAGGTCATCDVEEGKRLGALAAAMGCKPSEVNPATLASASKVAGCEWREVTPEKLAGKLAEVRAAVAAKAEALAEAKP